MAAEDVEGWRRAGFIPEEIAVLAEAGWSSHQVEDAETWCDLDFMAAEAVRWHQAGWDTFEADWACEWRDGGFTPEEASRWIKAGWATVHGEAASEWRAAGVERARAFQLHENGSEPEEAQEIDLGIGDHSVQVRLDQSAGYFAECSCGWALDSYHTYQVAEAWGQVHVSKAIECQPGTTHGHVDREPIVRTPVPEPRPLEARTVRGPNTARAGKDVLAIVRNPDGTLNWGLAPGLTFAVFIAVMLVLGIVGSVLSWFGDQGEACLRNDGYVGTHRGIFGCQ